MRGRGLDAEVGGQFTVTGDPAKPSVLGSLKLRRGTFNLAGHRLDFTRGNVALETATTIDPLLDFVATTTVNSTMIEVDITGTSRAPKIELTSTPQLPQDEAMAMLLFGKPSSGLSPFEVLSAAQALAELTGKSPVGGGALGKLRGGLGLDQLSINSSSSGSGKRPQRQHHHGRGRPLCVAGRLCRRQAGRVSGDSSRGVVEVEVLKHTKLTGDIGADFPPARSAPRWNGTDVTARTNAPSRIRRPSWGSGRRAGRSPASPSAGRATPRHAGGCRATCRPRP